MGELIGRYLVEVTPTMKGAAEDTIRLKAIMRKPIAQWSMTNLSAARIAAYRDERLRKVGSGTVIRELAYLSAIINHARREWGVNIPDTSFFNNEGGATREKNWRSPRTFKNEVSNEAGIVLRHLFILGVFKN